MMRVVQVGHRTLRAVVTLVGAGVFLIAGGLGTFVAASQIWLKLSGSVFGNESTDAVAFLLLGLFGALVYLAASIDRQLEKRKV